MKTILMQLHCCLTRNLAGLDMEFPLPIPEGILNLLKNFVIDYIR